MINLTVVDSYFRYIVEEATKFIEWNHLQREMHKLKSSTVPYTTTYFIQACRFGYADLCLDLFERQSSRIICYDSVPAFRTSCRNDHFEIVKWLFRILLASDRTHDRLYFIQLINDNAIDCSVSTKDWLVTQLIAFDQRKQQIDF